MSGKRAAGGWGPWSTALLVVASVAMVVWCAVAASMLFAVHESVPVEEAATTQKPSLSPMTGGTTLPTVLYTATPYDGPIPTRRTKLPSITAHPGETTGTTGPSGDPTSYPTGYPTYPPPTSPTDYPTYPTYSPTPEPTHGHGHTHGPH